VAGEGSHDCSGTWIGRSEGALVDFAVAERDGEEANATAGPSTRASRTAQDDKSSSASQQIITGLLTRVDTIFGATSVQLAPEHAVSKSFALEDGALRVKIEGLLAEQQKARESDALGAIEKHGVNTGRFAVNPFNGEPGADLGGELHSGGLWDGRDYERAGA